MYGTSFQPESGDEGLDEVLRGMARTFGGYRGSRGWGDSNPTLTHPVWDLSDRDYRYFCRWAPSSTDRSQMAGAIKYFLPRVAADLVADEDRNSNVPWWAEHLCSMLSEYDWHSWKSDEVTAIASWLTAWLRHTILHLELRAYRDEATLLAGVLGIDIEAVFWKAYAEEPTPALRWLARHIDCHWEDLIATGWPGGWHGYWGNHSAPLANATRFVALLLGSRSAEVLQAEFFRSKIVEDQDRYSKAIERIDHCCEFGGGEGATPLREFRASITR